MYMVLTKYLDGKRLYISQEDILSIEELEDGCIINLIVGQYRVRESADEIFKDTNNTYKFYDN